MEKEEDLLPSVAASHFDESDKTKESEQQDGLSNNDDREESEPEKEKEEEEEEVDEEGGVDEDLAENLIDINDNIVEDAEALNERHSLEEFCRVTINELKRLEEAEESGSEDDAAPSPTPTEQLKPDFLAPAESPAPGEPMVEHNGALAPATSPAKPAQGEKGDDASKPPGEPSFQCGSSEMNESVTSSCHEEHDPLLIPDQSSDPNALLGATNESLLKGFVSEAGKSAPPVTLYNQAGLPALGSEYMSVERRGEGGSKGDVCGERANDPEGLNEHRARAGHSKCAQPESGNQVSKSSENLTANTRVTHKPKFHPVPYPFGPPRGPRLAQQVRRLPMPQPYLYPYPHAPIMQPHQIPDFPQDPARDPPPLYRVTTPPSMTPPPHCTLQVPITQQMLLQMFNQQDRYSQTGLLQQMQPSEQQIQQQQQQPRPSFMQGPRGPQQQQQQQLPQRGAKRMATAPPLGTYPDAKRRMEMLIPDRRDNADCHVRTDTGPAINSVKGSTNHSTDSVTTSAVGRPGAAVTATPIGPVKEKSSAKAVAKVLASRGITMEPAGGGNNNVPATNQRQTLPRPVQVPAVPTPNLKSAITMIPTGNHTNRSVNSVQNSGFAVPENRTLNRQQNQGQGQGPFEQTNVVERPPRPPSARPFSVDPRGDGPTMGGHMRQTQHGNHHLTGCSMRGRPPPGSGGGGCRSQWHAFSTEEPLAQPMQLHMSPGRWCNHCTTQYRTNQALQESSLPEYHQELATGSGESQPATGSGESQPATGSGESQPATGSGESQPATGSGESQPATGSSQLALPVVDLKQTGTLSRLASIGIQHYLPLSQLSSQRGSYFGLPIVSMDAAHNPAVCNLEALGATNVLTLGPMKPLPR